ncbi:MAG: gp53-like domain-containing protein [Plesiomonas shigelloides]
MPKPSTPAVWASNKAFSFTPNAQQIAQGFDYIATIGRPEGAPITDDHDWPFNQVTQAIKWVMDQIPDSGLKGAAFKDVGTGPDQIPGISAFSSLLNSSAGWKKIPDATSPTGFFILQWGKFSGNGTTRVNGNFPIAFPNAVLVSFGFMSDLAQFASPANNRTVNFEATSLSAWGMCASAETSTFRFGFIGIGY